MTIYNRRHVLAQRKTGKATEIMVGVNDGGPFPVPVCLSVYLSVCRVLSVGGIWTRAPTNTVKNLGFIRTTDRLSFSKKYKKFLYVNS